LVTLVLLYYSTYFLLDLFFHTKQWGNWMLLNPNWHEAGHFHLPLVTLGLDFVSWICIKNFQTFLDVKIDINWVNLTPCQAHWVLQNLLLGGAKDEKFSCFLSSCQLGLIYFQIVWLQKFKFDFRKVMTSLFTIDQKIHTKYRKQKRASSMNWKFFKMKS